MIEQGLASTPVCFTTYSNQRASYQIRHRLTYRDLDGGVVVVLEQVAVDLVVLSVLVPVDLVPSEANSGTEVVLTRVEAEDVRVTAGVEAWEYTIEEF